LKKDNNIIHQMKKINYIMEDAAIAAAIGLEDKRRIKTLLNFKKVHENQSLIEKGERNSVV